jgi:hypothetical protein
MHLAIESGVTIEEFIERAKVRSTLSLTAWDMFTDALARQRAYDLQRKRKGAIKPSIFSHIASMPRALRRAVAVLIILAFLTVFFTLTKPGVALAQAAYEIIVKLFDGKLTAQQSEQPDNLLPIDFENIPEQFESLEQAVKVIGRPVASIEYSDAAVISISAYSIDDLMVTLRTQYQIKENILYLTQVFYEDSSSWGSAVSTENIELETELQDGNVMYIGYMDDGTIYGEAYSESYNVSVTCMGMDINELLDIVTEMRFIE